MIYHFKRELEATEYVYDRFSRQIYEKHMERIHGDHILLQVRSLDAIRKNDECTIDDIVEANRIQEKLRDVGLNLIRTKYNVDEFVKLIENVELRDEHLDMRVAISDNEQKYGKPPALEKISNVEDDLEDDLEEERAVFVKLTLLIQDDPPNHEEIEIQALGLTEIKETLEALDNPTSNQIGFIDCTELLLERAWRIVDPIESDSKEDDDVSQNNPVADTSK